METDRCSPTLSTTTSYDELQHDGQEHEVSTSTQKSKRPKNKTCCVCGDKALGHNFNAVTCESCKAFFRRNAFKNFKGRCEGKCEINVETRSYCKRCRLQKCLNVGMKKDLILNDEQRQQRRMKIEENRMRRSCPTMTKDQYNVITQSSFMTSPTQMTPSMTSPQGAMTSATIDYSPPPTETVLPPMATAMPSISQHQDPQHLLQQQQQQQQQLQQPQQQLQQPPPPQQQQETAETFPVVPKTESPSAMDEPINRSDTPSPNSEILPMCDFSLPEEFQWLIDELKTAYHNAFMLKPTLQDPKSTEGFVNLAEASSRRIVKMAKHIESFKGLDQKDQISLLKGAVVEILIMRSSKYFDAHTRSWNVPTANANPRFKLAPDILQTHSQESKELFSQYAAFASSLQQLTRGDHATMLLLIAMSIFSPDRSNLECRDVVSRIQEKYAECLSAYARQRFGGCRQVFPRLVQKLADIRELNETHCQMLQIVDTKNLEPLLVEIFDLSS